MDQRKVKKWLHDMNNRVGMILANVELMQLDQQPPRALERTKVIEEKSLELRNIIREMEEFLFQEQ